MASKTLRAVSNETIPAPAAPATCATWPDLLTALGVLFPEREEVIQATACAFLSREHAFMLGPAGTGKSALARCFAQAFDAPYFEALLTKYTVPGELFGEVDLPRWQSSGVYTRNVTGFAPEASVWFLDEVWKGSSAIVNALLTALNERKFRNGGALQTLPLDTCISASNELPEGEGLDPIYDRFLVRFEVRYLVERDAWLRMMGAPDPTPPRCTLSLAAEQAACAAVAITPTVLAAAWDIRTALATSGHVVSDRRWKRAMKLVQARAYLDGRTTAEPDDLDILEHALWREPKERTTVARTIQQHVNPAAAAAVERLDEGRDLWSKLSTDARNAPTPGNISELSGCLASMDRLLTDLASMPSGRKVNAARTEVQRMRDECARLTMRASGIKL